MIKKILFSFLFLVIGVGLLVWVIQMVGWQEIQSAFLFFTGWQAVIILFLTFLILFVASWKWKVILKSQGYNLSHRQLFAPYLTGYMMSYLLQMIVVGGEIFRIYVLKEKYSVPWKKAAVSVVVDKILDATSFIIAILVGVTFFLFKIGLPPKNLAIILGSVTFILIGGIGFFYLRCFRKKSIVRPLIKFFYHKGLFSGDILEIEKDIFSYFKLRKLAFWQGFGLALLRTVITWARCWVLILFLGKFIAFLPSISVLAFSYIAMLIPIPADLGAHEAIQVFTFTSLGLGAGTATAFAMIIRATELVMAFIGVFFFFKIGINVLQNVLFRKFENLINNRNNKIK